MSRYDNIPVIDLFAGPGGLGEGFSSLIEDSKRIFDIRLSIEKDERAHETLELRSFYRQFAPDELPEDYYEVLRAKSWENRQELKAIFFEKYPKEYKSAQREAWCAELGGKNFPPELIDERIKKALGRRKQWLLIGGPPCQAYSLVGRSRVGGIDENDHRVFLYQEYLRIIAKHHPSVFVMENVKGLLSAETNGEKIFSMILRDLQNPSSVFKEIECPNYRIFSFVSEPIKYDSYGSPVYHKDKDYLIECEKFGIPQKRHRVILLGIREDITRKPNILQQEDQVTLKSVIRDLPRIRSGLGRKILGTEIINGKKKRSYEQLPNTLKQWSNTMETLRTEISSWNDFKGKYNFEIQQPKCDDGSEFIKCVTPREGNPLYQWYRDPRIKGIANHKSRTHLEEDLRRYMFSSLYAKIYGRFPRIHEFEHHNSKLLPDHLSASSGKFADRFRVQLDSEPATTVTSHISKDGHYFIHYDPGQCRSFTVREAARVQTFPDNYLFCGARTAQYHQVGNAVPPLLARKLAEIVSEIF